MNGVTKTCIEGGHTPKRNRHARLASKEGHTPKRKRHAGSKSAQTKEACKRQIVQSKDAKRRFSSLNWRKLQEALCLVPAGLVRASCMQQRIHGPIEGCMQPVINFVNQGKHRGNVCLINTGMQASNIQTKQSHRQSLHCEPCES